MMLRTQSNSSLRQATIRASNASTLKEAVIWDYPEDPDNPKNWPFGKRVLGTLMSAWIGLLISATSSILVPAIPHIMQEFSVTDSLLGKLTNSVYVLGLGFGPFLLSPLSELYGRWIVYSTTLTMFTFLQVGCALSTSMTSLILFRFFSGVMGGVAPSLAQATVSDLWHVHDRGKWSPVLAMSPMLGPPVGNFAASFILKQQKWPWIFWTLTICSSVLLLLTLFLVQETYEPVILRRRQQRQNATNKESDCVSISSDIDLEKEPIRPSLATVLGHALSRPLRFLFTSPVLVICGFFLAYTYGMLFLVITSLPLLYGSAERHPQLFNYRFLSIGTGLAYLGLAVGVFIGCIVQMFAQTKLWNYLTKKNGEGRPEYRLLPMTAGMILFPVSLLLYGWSAERHYHWIVPQIGTAFLGIATYITFQSILVYLAEAFIPYSASAVAASTLMRSIAGAAFPLFGDQLFLRLGYGKGSTLLAALALPAIPLPWILYKYGRYLRQRWEFTA